MGSPKGDRSRREERDRDRDREHKHKSRDREPSRGDERDRRSRDERRSGRDDKEHRERRHKARSTSRSRSGDRHHKRDRSGEQDASRKRSRRDGDTAQEGGRPAGEAPAAAAYPHQQQQQQPYAQQQAAQMQQQAYQQQQQMLQPAMLAAGIAAAAAITASGGVPLTDLEAARLRALAGHDAEDQRKREREAEQAKLDDEMEKRRKRIEAWQEQRRKQQDEDAAAAKQQQAAAAADAPKKKQKKWTLEDESSDEDEQQQEAGEADGAIPAPAAVAAANGGVDVEMTEAGAAAPAAAAAVEEENDEVDPLDAFMQANVLPSAVKQQAAAAALPAAGTTAAAAAAAQEDEEVDPLDAFMQTNVLPAVKQEQVKQEQEQQPEAEAAAGTEPAAPSAAQQAAPAAAAAQEAAGGKQQGAPPPAAAAAAAPATAAAAAANGEASSKPQRRRRPSRYDSESSEEEADSSDEDKEEESEDEAEWMRKLIAGKLSKGDKLVAVDHATMQYPPFRRNFYIEVPELARMSAEEVEEYRKQLDGVKVRGKDVPKPVKNWHQCGLSTRILDVLRKGGFERPLSIQAQALPVIMSGRDCIGIAKTGSGKTLAFVLPMMRHVKDQAALEQGDGPVALAMAPTRELVTQIGKEVKRFAKVVGLTCVCVYGGSGVANQITELKRGTECVVCTPGRMIDILVTSGGKITNLRRVTYLVLDEADRMFDMGFEPQIMRIVQNIRPDRQTVMFSATFPRQVEALARQVLHNPVEIQVGGRSVVNKDITQYVEIRPEEDRFLRLLEVLGEWYEKGKLLIFVSSQDRCDTLFRDLLRAGYPCLSLHGGKDQSDRESTITDFKQNVCNILVATSVAARGLDVKDLVLVINYDVPNHHEDYVHRVGRTGRAGAKGTAITFIGPDEDQYAPDLVKALKESSAPIPADLMTLCEGFEKKRREGRAQLHSSGFGGSGFKFDASEDNAVKAYKKSQVKQMLKAQGEEADESESEDDGEIREVVGSKLERQQAATAAANADAQQAAALQATQQNQQATAVAALAAQQQQPAPPPMPQIGISGEQMAALPAEVQARIRAAQALAAKMSAHPPPPPGAPPPGLGIPAMPPGGAQPGGAAGAPGGSVVVPVQVALAAGWRPPPPPGSPPPPDNPILAAAQAAARRLAKEAGIPTAMYMPQQQMMPIVPVMPMVQPIVPVVPAMPMSTAPYVPQMPQQQTGAAAAAQPAAKEQAKHFETELEINDFPQHARWKITHRETIRDMGELGAAVVVKGKYYKLGTAPGPNDERKLYLHIEAPTAEVVKRAKSEIKRILEEFTEKAMRREGPAAGRYSVV